MKWIPGLASRVRNTSPSTARRARSLGFMAGVTLWWGASTHLLAMTPKLMDADDVRAIDKEYSEDFPFMQSGSRNGFSMPALEQNRSRINAIVQGNDEKRADELAALVTQSYSILSADADLRKACAWLLPIQERKLGARNAKTSSTALHLASMSMVARDYAQAKIGLKIALDGYSPRLDQLAGKESTGLMEMELLMALGYAGELALRERDYDVAEAFQRRLIAICHTQADARSEVQAMFQIGRILHAKGDLQGARREYDLAFARAASQDVESPENLTEFDMDSAVLYLDAGDRDGARREAKTVSQCNKIMANWVFSFHEGISLMASKLFDPFSLVGSIGDPEPLAQLILDWKGAALETEFAIKETDRLAAERHVNSTLLMMYRSNRQTAATLEAQGTTQSKKKRLQDLADARAKLKTPGMSAEARRTILETMEDPEEQAKHLGAQLAAAGVTETRFTTTIDQVSHALAPGQVLVEYLRYDRYVGNAQWQRAYGAMIFSHDGKPVWVPFERATTLDAKISDFRRVIGEADPKKGAQIKEMLQGLREAVWTPLAKALPANVDDVVISPDGALSFVPFAALVDAGGNFLARDYRLSFVTSGRDLVRPMPKRSGGAFVLFGNPDYLHATSGAKDNLASLTEAQRRSLEESGFTLGDLPGAEKECQQLADLFRSRKLSTDLKIGADASEAALRKLRSPQAIHLATHGAFLPPQQSENLASLFGDNAEERSAVFLAGAQRSLNERARGVGVVKRSNDEIPEFLRKQMSKSMPAGVTAFDKPSTFSTDNDGVVTAEEIGGLHLDGTWLVTLSACETALGQARAGQGVIGLRRSFVEAGAQNLLMSLWTIDDDITPEIMVDFYRRALAGSDAARAWSETQRDWLAKLSAPDSPYGKTADERFFSAVFHAGAFVLSRQGAPHAP